MSNRYAEPDARFFQLTQTGGVLLRVIEPLYTDLEIVPIWWPNIGYTGHRDRWHGLSYLEQLGRSHGSLCVEYPLISTSLCADDQLIRTGGNRAAVESI